MKQNTPRVHETMQHKHEDGRTSVIERKYPMRKVAGFSKRRLTFHQRISK